MFKQHLLCYVCSYYALRTSHSDTVLGSHLPSKEYANLSLDLGSSPRELECQLLTYTEHWEVHAVF